MDHFYQSLPGYFDFEDVYLDAVRRAEPGGILVELGVLEARSLAFLAVEAFNAKKSLSVFGVDLFVNEWNPEGYRQRIQHQFDMRQIPVHLMTSRSDLAAEGFAPRSVDFVFIDADHFEASVRADIAAWRSKIKPGGTMAGHDLKDDEFPGVGAAVREAFTSWEKCSVCSWRVRL